MKKLTFVRVCRCLGKSEKVVRNMIRDGNCDFGFAMQGSGNRLNYFFNAAKLREYVGPKRFDQFFN